MWCWTRFHVPSRSFDRYIYIYIWARAYKHNLVLSVCVAKRAWHEHDVLYGPELASTMWCLLCVLQRELGVNMM